MSELNKKILALIDYRGMRNFDREGFQSYNAEEIESVANSIERLVLQREIDLIDRVINNSATISDTKYYHLQKEKIELTQQLQNIPE